MALILDGQEYALSHLAPAYCILREPRVFSPCDGEIVLQVDGNVTSLQVRFPQGSSTASSRIAYEQLAPPSRTETVFQSADAAP